MKSNIQKGNIYKNKTRNKFYENKNQKEKNSDTNYCNYYLLSDSDKRRIMFLLERIEHVYDKSDVNYEENEINKKMSNYLLRKTYEQKNLKLINSKEIEKFFIFICNLSIYQLKTLNDTQPNPSNKRNDLPIIFNNQFKDCLTNAQRMDLACLESMSLTRYIILKDTNEDICPENLDFRFMKYRIKDTDSDGENENDIENNKIQNKKSRGWKNTESNVTQDLSNNNYNYKFNNSLSSRIKSKYDLEEENVDVGGMNEYENLLNSVKNEENKDFIDNYKKNIIKVLKELDKEDKKIFFNDKNILKKLLKKTKKSEKKSNTTRTERKK